VRIEMGGKRWRRWGIDAPEMSQTSGGWTAGVAATYALADLMRDKAITCEDRGRDRYGRTIGPCRTNGEDPGAEMVSAGMALGLHSVLVRPHPAGEGGDRGGARCACARLRKGLGLAEAVEHPRWLWPRVMKIMIRDLKADSGLT
jgi:endonuclease YncB( thermonuclease family)